MAEIKVGDKLIDNDPRMGRRILLVVELYPNGLLAEDSTGRYRRYLSKRIFTDGKARRYGLNKLLNDEVLKHG